MNDFAGLQRPTGINWQGQHYGTVQYGEDSRLVVIFYIKSVMNPLKSQAAGMPVHEDQVYVRIHEPGERLNQVDRPVTDNDKHRFQVQWSRFVSKTEQRPDGTPVDLLFPNNPSVADNLKGYGIYTVQQLSNLSANAMDNVGMGAQEWVNMAKRFLSNASDGAAFHVMQQELDKLKQEARIRDQQYAELKRQHDALYAKFIQPDKHSMQPSWQPGHDAQAERINSNHPSQEAKVDAKA